jgi:hypothetical protein
VVEQGQPEPNPSADSNGAPPVHVLKLATFCTSQAEFIAQFKAFLDDDTLFLPSKVALSIGQTVEFSICLQDERPMLEGRGEVVHVRSHVGGRAARSGLRVKVRELSPSSRLIKAAIISARTAAKAAGGEAAPAPAGGDPRASATITPLSSPATPSARPPVEPTTPAPAIDRPQRTSAPLGRLGVATKVCATPPPVSPGTGGPTPRPITAGPGPGARTAPAAKPLDPSGLLVIDGDDAMAEPPAPPPAEVTYPRQSASPPSRLFAQGVQVAVPASHPMLENRKDDFEAAPASPFVEVSTKSIVSSIDSSLNHTRRAHTPVTMVESQGQDQGQDQGRDQGQDDDDLYGNGPRRDGRGSLRPSRTELPRLLAATAFSSLATLAGCWFLWGRTPAPPPPSPVVVARALRPAVPAPTPPPAREPAPAPSPTPATRAPEAAAAAPAERPSPAAPVDVAPVEAPAGATPTSGKCSARITSLPSGAVVTLGGHRLGETPFQSGHLPCETIEVALNRPRYAPTTASVTPGRSKATPALVKLMRPQAHLVLTSTPPNATFKVNRATVAGEASVSRFEKARIEATLAGYKPWKKTVYVTAASMTVNVALVPGRRGHSHR